MAAGALVINKRIPYRGDPTEVWSNKYYYLGSDPADAAAWRTFFDQVVAEEKKLYPSTITVVGGYGYDDDDPDATAVWSVDLTVAPNAPVAGSYSDSTMNFAPGDVAAWIRWGTSRFNTKGKRIYCRKYFHHIPLYAAPAGDNIQSNWITAAGTYGGYWHDGAHFGNRTISAAGHDDTIVGHAVSAYATTRTLKRRGKRP